MDPRILAALQQHANALRAEFGSALNGLAASVETAKNVTTSRMDLFKGQNPGGFDIKDIPCQRRAYWLSLDIALTKGSTAMTSGTTPTPTDGAFVIERIVPIWVPTDADPADYPLTDAGGAAVAANYQGRSLPVSGKHLLEIGAQLGASSTLTDIVNAMTGIPEFDISLQTSGDSRTWNQGNIPLAALFGIEDAYRLRQPGWINNRDSLTVSVLPTRSVPYDGTLRFVFSGYKLRGVDSVDGELNRLAEQVKLAKAK